jgi:ubiquitin carboxyl-terminal hydrolase L5
MASIQHNSDSELSEVLSIPTPDTTPLRNRPSARATKPANEVQLPTQPGIAASPKEDSEFKERPEREPISGNIEKTSQRVNETSGISQIRQASFISELPHEANDIETHKPEGGQENSAASITKDELSELTENRTVNIEGIIKDESTKADQNGSNVLKELIYPERESKSEDAVVNGQRSVKRKRDVVPDIPPIHFEPPYSAATEHEKSNWGGFCEIESDPAVFNNVLRGFGVEGVKIQEVYSLDEEMLAYLPKPVYGLIFLYQYTAEGDGGEQVDECPQHVWFANQVVENCCGTIALLNVVNNIPSEKLLLSEQFRRFKDFTASFPPAFRGDQVSSCTFIKRAHNAYARKIDMLNADLCLEEAWTESQKKKPKGNGRGGSRKNKKNLQAESAFHFVAYLPIDGDMWRLDGLDGNPQNLGACNTGTENWLQEIAPLLSARMAACSEDGLQFSLLAMVPDELTKPKLDLVENMQLLRAIEDKLEAMNIDWKQFVETLEDGVDQSMPEYAFLEQHLVLGPDESTKCHLKKFDDLTSLLDLHRKTVKQQSSIREKLIQSDQPDLGLVSEEIRALDRQNDYVPFIQKWIFMLAQNQELKDLVEAH